MLQTSRDTAPGGILCYVSTGSLRPTDPTGPMHMAFRIESQSEPIPGYRLLDRIGAGGYGEVWRAQAPGGIFKAIKVIHGDLRSKDNDLVRYAEQELKSLKRVQQVRHPYLLTLDRYDIIEGRLLITMELADCNLWDRFRECREAGHIGIPREELLGYMGEIAEVLDLFNDHFQLQHLDIKPQNLFLLQKHVKVADFGQVKDLEGLIAQVTGGITPVYAAPETFDGLITPYCDQYSLACVYQELLTGVRPFDGVNLNHLVMQHLNLPPNLTPSPACDRPALARALAKSAQDRWPTVTAFVRALGVYANSETLPAPAIRTATRSPALATASVQAGSGPVMWSAPPNPPAPPVPQPVPRPVAQALVSNDTPLLETTYEPTEMLAALAPPETAGPGPLRPALIVGLGHTGLRILQRLRYDLTERYGSAQGLPAIRMLYIDTDPADLNNATTARPQERMAALRPDEICPAPLNRATHYLKPRLSGRNLIDSWFDAQLLYKIPREPQTLGMRPFGRLAFCDHYRTIATKIQTELEAAIAEESLSETESQLNLPRRTNRPQVYVVASTAGGTGGGMFVDIAYTLRSKLERMGYTNPEVSGVLLLPEADSSHTPPQALANTYATLVELNHFSRSDSTFSANYDDRNGPMRYKCAPFTRCYLAAETATSTQSVSAGAFSPAQIPSTNSARTANAKSGSRAIPMPAARRNSDSFIRATDIQAVELIRLSLFTPIGRVSDEEHARESRAKPGAHRLVLSAFGYESLSWPRSEVVARTAERLTRKVLTRWAAADPKRAREIVPTLAREKWSRLSLDPEPVLERLRNAADKTAGGSIEDRIARCTDPLVPRGWLARLPEPARVVVAVDQITNLLGPPVSTTKRAPTAVEAALAEAADSIAETAGRALHEIVLSLINDARFRIAGAEEFLRQCLVTAERMNEMHLKSAAELDSRAIIGFQCAAQYAHHRIGLRKPTSAEFGEAIRQYPRVRFQAMLFRVLAGVCHSIRQPMLEQMAEISAARQLIGSAVEMTLGSSVSSPPSQHQLLPAGCRCVDEAVERFLGVISEANNNEIERRIQETVANGPDDLLHLCVNPTSGANPLRAIVLEVIRSYLDRRLGETDLAAMVAERYPNREQAKAAIEQLYQRAVPAWVGSGPWSEFEVMATGCPAGQGGTALHELVQQAIPERAFPIVDTPDSLTIYREWPALPLTALPHLGPEGAAAYRTFAETQQSALHARMDITQWANVDQE